MDIIDLVLSYFIFDTTGIIGLSALFLIFLVQLYYYLSYYRKPLSYLQKNTDKEPDTTKRPSVSVVIIAKNESENLAENLPYVLDQDYPNYEVVVVNDGSTDESYHFLESLAKDNPHLYHTFSPISEDKDSDRRRILAMTIGIKAARNEVLLFTEAGSRPLSNKWIESMVRNLSDDKEIVLGYSQFNIHSSSLWGKLAHFDNLLFSLQYLSKAIKQKPFTGTYRNIAYKKYLFFENKGFSSTLNFENAEEIFFNRIMNSHNTAIEISNDSFTSTKIENYYHWKNLKTIYARAKSQFTESTPNLFKVETSSRYIFHLLALCGIVYSIISSLWIYLAGFILIHAIRFIIQSKILGKASIHFVSPLSKLSLPILETLQPIYNNRFWRLSKKRKRGKLLKIRKKKRLSRKNRY